MASTYLNEIQKIIPQGPYILVGESLGGKIAYEMAQQLLKKGQKTPLLVLLDTFNMQDSNNLRDYTNHNLSYFWMLLKKHTSILVKSDWQGKLEYLRFYRETARPKIKHFFARRFKTSKKQDKFALPENVREIERANLRAARLYQVKPYPGRVILIKALRGPNAEHPSNDWDKVKLGELVVHTLDCYHGSILFEPAVSQLASILQVYIQENIQQEHAQSLST